MNTHPMTSMAITIVGSSVLSIVFLVTWILHINYMLSSPVSITRNNTCTVMYPVLLSPYDMAKSIVRVNDVVRMTTSDMIYTSYYTTHINHKMGKVICTLTSIASVRILMMMHKSME